MVLLKGVFSTSVARNCVFVILAWTVNETGSCHTRPSTTKPWFVPSVATKVKQSVWESRPECR